MKMQCYQEEIENVPEGNVDTGKPTDMKVLRLSSRSVLEIRSKKAFPALFTLLPQKKSQESEKSLFLFWSFLF